MPPNQSPRQNDYDFILNDAPSPARKVNLGGSKLARIIAIVVGLILLIIIFVVASSFLNKASNEQKLRLTETAQAQTELIRISTIGATKARDLGVRALATTVQLSLTSERKELTTTLVQRGVKAKGIDKTLGATKNPKTDTALNDATANNRFDATFLEILNKQLTDYKRLVQNASGGANNTEKKALSTALANIESLKKSKHLQPTTSGSN